MKHVITAALLLTLIMIALYRTDGINARMAESRALRGAYEDAVAKCGEGLGQRANDYKQSSLKAGRESE